MAKSQSLISPVADFFLVGGLSLIVILPFLFFDVYTSATVLICVSLAYVINDPHFIHSYQLMYENFRQKIKPQGASGSIWLRYVFAGIIVPILFFGWFAYCFQTKNVQALAYTGNLMILTVGWHYAKQGYGMLIVLSALKKIYYGAYTKNILLVNSYALWITTWILFNLRLSELQIGDYLVKSFPIPDELLFAAMSFTLMTSCAAVFCLARHGFKTKRVSVNGLVGYFSAYIWLFVRTSSIALNALIPVFHSLQYLPFVWKYKYAQAIHESKDESGAAVTPFSPMLRPFRNFILTGLGIGVLAFHLGPFALDRIIPYDHSVFGTNLFFFMIIIFINVHHYFIDNVIWRKENSDVGLYLFGGYKKPKQAS